MSAAYERALEVLRSEVGCCREWVEETNDLCGRPAEYVLWGKLIPAAGLGPRCYDHAAMHVGHRALGSDSTWALINLARVARALTLGGSG